MGGGDFEASMIEHQVKELREMSIRQRSNAKVSEKVFFEIENVLSQAADTIETLSAKLAATNRKRSDRCYGDGWIACEDRLTDGGGMYIVTAAENGLYHTTFAKWQPRYKDWDLRGCRSHWKVIAWQPLPEPHHP